MTAGLLRSLVPWLVPSEGPVEARRYDNRRVPLADPGPVLADHPELVAPIDESARYEAPALVDDADSDLHVRAWRFSKNARGIIEISWISPEPPGGRHE